MKSITGLFIIMALIHLIWLTNITLLKSEYNGIAMWLSTGLFIAGTAFYIANRRSEEDQ
ncbi:hypothetical protein [Sporosarcina pasteurii]|uniref:Uncharacterized protein n=1 Tax=Sporosarcina pasteurii TaxID=1474 RepID=A0A380CHX4_SPOPA|nr:hypothetical protein [Sporosarcina pasteurii]MDS9472067.1 hypothetical protein [Sporosarcina pasteurii]SUJ20876.1 Uncharacterised protein [Sporosarcina pasteurii]